MRLLIVDDNMADQYLLREAAETSPSPLDLTFAMDGPHALAILKHLTQEAPGEIPHLILLDIHMPGLSGLDVLERLKTDPQLCAIPVVMLTTSNLPQDISRAFTLRANAYMQKHRDFVAFQDQFHKLVDFWQATLFPVAS
ncbi:response regulator [Deinococcus sp. JMULE3]|uniref:response regulator n=1 Tax=Deinococcus sp. JMULE3 TaxID=2518341 RepID=UPI00157730B5|nr:response regulator [Deinococcus sp. JMULE3]NTY02379.1 response regulator [Deinococcus sp. JMULE3]